MRYVVDAHKLQYIAHHFEDPQQLMILSKFPLLKVYNPYLEVFALILARNARVLPIKQ